MSGPSRRHWGYDLLKLSGLRSGVLYPILRRMLEEGWLKDGWEDPAEITGRPPRRYYELTEAGVVALGALAAPSPRPTQPATLRSGPVFS
jgi:PadR family transcriptional regulator, regulatory protein PadR